MTGKKVKRIVSGIVALNMISAYCGVFPMADSGVSFRTVSHVNAAGTVSYSLSSDGKTLLVSGTGSVVDTDVLENITDSVTDVVISEGITRIEAAAFYNNKNIVSVDIPESVGFIGNSAFEKCSNLENAVLSASLNSSTFGRRVFKDCVSLKSVSLGSNVKAVGEETFRNCGSIKEILIPASVENIANYAFRDCESLNLISFEGGISEVKSIGSYAFSGLDRDPEIIEKAAVIKQRGKRLLEENVSDKADIDILKSAGLGEIWFEKLTPTEKLFSIVLPDNTKYDGTVKTASVEPKEGVTGYGNFSVTYKDKDGKSVAAPKAVGDYDVYVSVTGGDNYFAGSDIYLDSFSVYSAVFSINSAVCENGSVSADKTKCGQGGIITLTVTPADGYFIKAVSYNDGTEHIITPSDGVYSFAMPEKDVTVKASFEKPVAVAAVPATCTETGTKAYWTLDGKAFEDAACTKEIENLSSWKVVSKLNHDYAEVSSKPATCTSKGSKTEKCKNCGDEKTAEFAAKGHSFGDWTLTKEATETEPGTETRKCSSCDAEETRETALKAHEHKAGEPVVIPASCTKDGSKVVKCASCGETLSTEKISKTGHTEGEWSVKTAATCTLDGIRELKCAVCAAVIDTEAIPAAGHKPGKFEVKTAATCTADGEAVQKCTSCGEELDTKKIEAAGHKAGEFEVKTAATCTADGEAVQKCTVCKEVVDTKKIEATGHKAGGFEVKAAATCTADGEKVQKCTSCGETLSAEKITKTGHSFGDWKVVKEPTETETGLKARTCSACKKTEEQEMAVLVHTHTPGAFEVKTAATCTADGEEVQKCTSCGEVLDVKKIEAAGHKAGEFEVKTAATCETDGVNVQKCTVCGEVLETETVSKTGHRFGEWTVTAEPTETEAGVKTRVCDVCKKTETETVAALGHTHKPGAYETVPATCTADGKSVQKCLGCGEVLDEKVIKSEGHKWNSEAAVDKAATCTEDGSRSVHCSVCGETKDKEVIPAEGHSFGDWKINKLPTLTDAGTEIRACEKCGTEETRDFPPAKTEVPEEGWNGNNTQIPEIVKPVVEHKYSDWKVTKEPTWSSQGEQSRVCADCDNVQTRPYGEAGITTVKKAVVKVIRKIKSFLR